MKDKIEKIGDLKIFIFFAKKNLSFVCFKKKRNFLIKKKRKEKQDHENIYTLTWEITLFSLFFGKTGDIASH